MSVVEAKEKMPLYFSEQMFGRVTRKVDTYRAPGFAIAVGLVVL